MARRRMIDPEFWSDEEIGFLNGDTCCTYIGMWNFSDDYGVVKASPIWLKGKIFPYREVDIKACLQKLVDLKKIVLFEAEGNEYYWIKNFLKIQKVDKPSKNRNPQPPVGEDSPSTPAPLNDEVKISKAKGSEIKSGEASPDVSSKPLGDAFKKYNFNPQSKGITKAWQDKAIRYAEALKIDLDDVIENQKVRPRWFKVFRQADEENRKPQNIEKAYSYLMDHENFQQMSNENKLKFFFSIYENGLQSNYNYGTN